MAKSSVAKTVMDMAKPIVESLGYELVEVDYSKKNVGMVLTLYIYSQKGISLDDCEKVSKAVDEPLDLLNPTNDASYSLNVSSLGLDRPIKTADDCRRNLNNKVEVKLYAPLNNKKSFIGVLCDFNEKGFSLKVDEDILNFEFGKIAGCSPVIEF